MILILTDGEDFATHSVCDWIHYQKQIFRTVQYIKDITVAFDTSKDTIIVGDIDFSTIRSFWYRRGEFNLTLPKFIKDTGVSIDWEWTALSRFLYLYIKTKKSLGSYRA
jgi:hypothetical protein